VHVKRKGALWAVLALVVAAAVVVLVVRSRPDNSATARTERLEHELACPVCEGQSVADSNAPESRAIRADIPRRINAGQSDEQIRAAYVALYGQRILLTPSNGGIGLVAWVVPAVAVLLGAFGIGIALRRWSRTPRLTATPQDEARVRDAREHELEVEEL
jgi:cytochrome c-type biogenesis protein CcmH